MVNNQGIMHAAFRSGGEPLCRKRNAHMSKALDGFRLDSRKCKRCEAKLAKMDAKKPKT